MYLIFLHSLSIFFSHMILLSNVMTYFRVSLENLGIWGPILVIHGLVVWTWWFNAWLGSVVLAIWACVESHQSYTQNILRDYAVLGLELRTLWTQSMLFTPLSSIGPIFKYMLTISFFLFWLYMAALRGSSWLCYQKITPGRLRAS